LLERDPTTFEVIRVLSVSRALADVWAEKGKPSMLYTAEKQPAVFFATCARLIGPEVKLTIEQDLPTGLSTDDWSLMR